ncbi:helix-turn-helix domain-containing protein [Mycobacterium marseillense]|uniref:helix-turn-helix domain-containing protein n=1 Tax=Mycobacterium marseillense TaxID=701042 RepID=UPI0011A3D537|nr:helix-turn-helix domain-containing protein [Mycobacterium marseillense]
MGDDDVNAAMHAASLLMDAWRYRGVPLPGWLVAHHRRMQAIAARGKGIDAGTPQLEHAKVLDTQAAATMLNMSPRWVRLHATEIGGRKVGNRNWVFESRALREHLEGAK